MQTDLRLASCLLVLSALAGCASPSTFAGKVPIDLVPRYGDMDRSARPELAAADRKLIEDTTAEFGSRAAASVAFAERGMRLYGEDDYENAMRRLNQAWLLDPENAVTYWGFAVIYHDHGDHDEALKWAVEALEHGLDRPVAVSDAGVMYARCVGRDPSLAPDVRRRYSARSEELLQDAMTGAEPAARDYITSNWAFARLSRGDHAGAWKKVHELRERGATFSPDLLEQLSAEMPDPTGPLGG